jgi:hypothetical protein
LQLATSGNEKEKKEKKINFFLFFSRAIYLFLRRFPYSPRPFFSLLRVRKCQLHPDLPGLRRFRQFVARFCNFCINFSAFLAIFSIFLQKGGIPRDVGF